MDGTTLMLSFLFGSIGMGMVMYGKKTGRFVAMGAGAGLLVIPYLVTNVVLMVLLCGGMMAAPWIVREG